MAVGETNRRNHDQDKNKIVDLNEGEIIAQAGREIATAEGESIDPVEVETD